MSEDSSDDKYIVYKLGSEFYATPLMEVREVIEFRQAKPIPHTSPFYKGVINIRGEIVGVLDLRERLRIADGGAPTAELVFETENGTLAAIVDRVLYVTVILDENLERQAPIIGPENDRPFLLGVGKFEEKLLTVISLRKILTPELLLDLSGPKA